MLRINQSGMNQIVAPHRHSLQQHRHQTLRLCTPSVPWRTRLPLPASSRAVSLFGSRRLVPCRPSRERQRLGRLEAVLLLAREPISLRKLAALANLADATQARTLIERMRKRYDDRSCAFQIEQLAGGFQLLTRGQFGPWLSVLPGGSEDLSLSGPALETLAVVAYRQPVLRAEVEAIRGVQCGELLRQLMERDLLRIVGRSDQLGRPLLYGTTKQFLSLFGLSSLDALPRAAELRRGPTAA